MKHLINHLTTNFRTVERAFVSQFVTLSRLHANVRKLGMSIGL